MTSAPVLQPTFLENRNEIGVVAVGFSGGQVGYVITSRVSLMTDLLTAASDSAKRVSMPRLCASLKLA